MYTYEQWRQHYELPDTAESRREYREYVEALAALEGAANRQKVGDD